MDRAEVLDIPAIPPEDLRRVERHGADGWTQVRLRELRSGDVFRMFEPEGEPVGGEWVATCDAYTIDSTGARNSLRLCLASKNAPDTVRWGIDGDPYTEPPAVFTPSPAQAP